jgi:hypothetical protein
MQINGLADRRCRTSLLSSVLRSKLRNGTWDGVTEPAQTAARDMAVSDLVLRGAAGPSSIQRR